jgi:hypothetical protein
VIESGEVRLEVKHGAIEVDRVEYTPPHSR